MGIVHGTAGTVCTVLGFIFLGLAAIRFLWLSAPAPVKPPEKIPEHHEPRPLCACSRRGPASMNMRRLVP